MTAEIEGRHYVIPSMVGGKQLSGRQAVRVAERMGLRNYPSFATADKALRASEDLHDRQPDRGGAGLDDRRLLEALR